MSLLLQALQKAAKTRAEGDVAESLEASSSQELTLEPALSGPRPASAAPASSPAQAATVVQASRVPAFDAIDYAREHYMLTFVGAAFLLAVCYAAYVYIQVKAPFRTAVPPPALIAAPSKPTVTVAIAPVLPPGAKISGMPGAATYDDAARPQKVATLMDAGAGPSTAEPPSPGAAFPRRSAAVPLQKPYAKADSTKQNSPAHVVAPSMPRNVNIEPVGLTDATDSIETVVIPASRSKSPGNVSVHRDPAGVTSVSPVLIQAYETLQRGEIARAK